MTLDPAPTIRQANKWALPADEQKMAKRHACPKCGAPIGESCSGFDGRTRVRAHKERLILGNDRRGVWQWS